MPTARIEPRDGSIDTGEVRLHYLDWGNEGQPPLVLLHGFSSQAHYWDGFAVRMRDDFHVYALDQRGHGDSDWSEDYGPETMPADLLAFLDERGIERATLVGHSMGGGVSMRFAAQHPDRVERVVVVDAGLPSTRRAVPTDNSVQRALATDTFVSEEDLLDYYQRLNPKLDRERALAPLMHNFRKLEDGSLTYKFDPALRDRLAHMREGADDLTAACANVTAPVLIIRGGRSDILTAEAARETAAAFANGSMVEIPNTTHMVPTDDPANFRRVVREFLGVAG